MPPGKRQIEMAFVRERLRAFVDGLWRGRWALLAVVAILAALVWLWSPREELSVVRAEVVGGHVRESKFGSFPYAVLRFENGDRVMVRVPRDLVLPSGVEVEVRISRNLLPPRGLHYTYVRRAEPLPRS